LHTKITGGSKPPPYGAIRQKLEKPEFDEDFTWIIPEIENCPGWEQPGRFF